MKTDTKNNLLSFINNVSNWTKEDMVIVTIIDSPLLDKKYIMKDVFVLKKFVGGQLTSNANIKQIMFACQFNKVRTVNNIEEIEVINQDNHYIIHSNSKENQITIHIINKSKGGVFHD